MKKAIIIICALIFSSCTESQEKISKSAILITNVDIVDVLTGNIIKNRQVIVDSTKIQKIVATVSNIDQYTKVIDGKGKFLLPGLAEMHAHIPRPSTRNPELVDETLFLYLSNGITTIRGMLGHPSHLGLREKAKRNEILSPRIYTSSPSLNGNSIKTKEEAIAKVTQYKKDGYDFLKIHPGIKLDAFNQTVTTAKEVGISFAGHVPVDVGVRHAMESRYASIDHIDGFIEGLVPSSANVDPNQNGYFGYNFTLLTDVSYIDELVDLANKNKIWVVPTQSLFDRRYPVTAEELLKEPEMKYMAQSTLKNWKQRKEQFETGYLNDSQWKKFNSIRRSFIKKLNDKSHRVLLGSDAPQIFNVPGFSIHHEIDGMLRAGITPLQIIQSGTINPAVFFGEENTFGEVKEGFAADLILVNSNPLGDMKALKDISGVMVRGKWLSKEMIEVRLAEIAKRNINK